MTKLEQIGATLAVLICAALYYPVLAGLPIWDDTPVWFYDPSLKLPYNEIFRSYTWPMSVAFQKFLFTLWGHKYNIYHAVNICLHLLNGLLLYGILSDLKIRGKIAVALVFLFHPANVITVSWMIQMKTLLSFFFAALSLRVLILYHQNPLARGGSGILFLLSVLSKSGSLLMPALFIVTPRKWDKKFLITILLGSGVAAFALIKIFTSGEVHEYGLSQEPFRISVILRTISYYFWQAFFPVNTVPVKDLNLETGLWFDIITLTGILFLIYYFRKEFAGKVLLVAQIFLLPFYGIIPAPYMNHTLVGDQHLYLVLPLYWIFVMNIPLKKEAVRIFLVTILLPFYGLKIQRSLPYFKGDIAFYSSVMEAYPGSLSIGMNLAFYYLTIGEVEKSQAVMNRMDQYIQKTPRTRQNKYYPEFLIYRERIRNIRKDK